MARPPVRKGSSRTAKRPAKRQPPPAVEPPRPVPEPEPLRVPLPTSEGLTLAHGVYVYGVLRTEEALRFGPIGLGVPPAEVSTLVYRGLGAVVSKGPLGVPDPTRDNVLTHHRVQEAVMREHTLLPTAFGLTFPAPEDVTELLRAAHDAFSGVLARLEGHVELGLKVLWDQDRVTRELEQADAELGRLALQPPGSPGRLEYERALARAIQERARREGEALVEALRPVAAAARVVSPVGERMMLNAVFLVAREREAAFDARVKSLAANHAMLTFQFTGPWAPYHFADIRLRLTPEEPPKNR
ncbi:GvpL/GvpF family gas vesicle protein [Stigmatella erecta]|uniref:Gas vesicle synthesis protein GvpL/GvpF n=1 Tax=Stigmatella erecta TaxID=83460 RepID=A0A1I0JZ58_9BACT|nr:GvpL/GvpF family gas vesicle protein [Stigmatella erecta]SEU16371.1 Gas vesicle synthesis protein GvpL/GvpF [Stigmatella erecta]